jgi:hypothetical protein
MIFTVSGVVATAGERPGRGLLIAIIGLMFLDMPSRDGTL